jgi:hypothetical protein
VTRNRIRWAAVLLTALLVVAGACTDDEGSGGTTEDSTDDSTPAADAGEGPATGPTVAPGETTPTTALEIPDPPPIPAPGEATLELGGEPIEVVLNRCEYNPSPEVGLDVTMNPPTASAENPAGLVLIVPTAQPGPQLVDAISAALQLEGDASFLPLDGRLDLADDLLSGTLIFQVVRGEEAIIGTAAFACAPA